jgi:hypothetical protein
MKGDYSMEINDIPYDEVNGALSFSSDDESIIYYLLDKHGKEILSSFEHRPENTGVALFFEDDFKDLILVMRMKYFKESKDNGLLLFRIEKVYDNPEAKEDLILIVNKSFSDSKYLRDNIISQIENHTRKSIDHNVR